MNPEYLKYNCNWFASLPLMPWDQLSCSLVIFFLSLIHCVSSSTWCRFRKQENMIIKGVLVMCIIGKYKHVILLGYDFANICQFHIQHYKDIKIHKVKWPLATLNVFEIFFSNLKYIYNLCVVEILKWCASSLHQLLSWVCRYLIAYLIFWEKKTYLLVARGIYYVKN